MRRASDPGQGSGALDIGSAFQGCCRRRSGSDARVPNPRPEVEICQAPASWNVQPVIRGLKLAKDGYECDLIPNRKHI